jgi:hypothetical protein
MVDKNNNGIDDNDELQYAKEVELAKQLGIDPPPPPTPSGETEAAAAEEDVSRIFAGETRVPTYDSGIGRRDVGRIPVEQTREQALAEFAAFSAADRKRLERIAKAAGVDTKFSSLQWFWQQGVNNAQAAYATGQRITPWEYLESWAQSPEGRLGVSLSGGAAGPRETITMASERDLRAAVDAMAAQVLGRAATDDEFQNALKQVRAAETGEPTITTTGPGRTVTQSGLTAEGRSSIIQEALMKGPEAEDFGKATKMMDLFYSALEARPSGA